MNAFNVDDRGKPVKVGPGGPHIYAPDTCIK